MLSARRRDVIVDQARHRGGVRVRELAAELGVSDMTIRRDIEVLVDLGLMVRVHGGALAVDTATAEPAYAEKVTRQSGEKAAIARAAARLVAPGAAIGISAGTTTAAVARELVGLSDLTVVTNSVAVSDVLHKTDHTVILTGGVRTVSDALVGPASTALLGNLNLDIIFLGVHGMSVRNGFTTPNLAEAETNRALVAAARTVVVVADHTKWDVVGIATVMPLRGAHIVITDQGLHPEACDELRSEVADVLIVEPA